MSVKFWERAHGNLLASAVLRRSERYFSMVAGTRKAAASFDTIVARFAILSTGHGND
jgi:hypothetical protein